MNKKTVSNSQVIMHELVLPNETNVHGNIFGGKVMYYMDMCAAMSAYKHARKSVVNQFLVNKFFPHFIHHILI